MELGERDGMEDVESALAAAKAQGLAEELMMIQFNCAHWSARLQWGGRISPPVSKG